MKRFVLLLTFLIVLSTMIACGKGENPPCTSHMDADFNHLCDTCQTTISTCMDKSADHLCDTCNRELSPCKNTNGDHVCDICGKVLTPCVDESNDHICDICHAVLSACKDTDKDSACDICGKTVEQECTDHTDENYDHKCDHCETIISTCADNNSDHLCDTCDAELSKCKNTNGDHACDICDKALSVCIDETHDHKCDICKKDFLSQIDDNFDHKCDLCDLKISSCTDENDFNGRCDICNKRLSSEASIAVEDFAIAINNMAVSRMEITVREEFQIGSLNSVYIIAFGKGDTADISYRRQLWNVSDDVFSTDTPAIIEVQGTIHYENGIYSGTMDGVAYNVAKLSLHLDPQKLTGTSILGTAQDGAILTALIPKSNTKAILGTELPSDAMLSITLEKGATSVAAFTLSYMDSDIQVLFSVSYN